MQDFFCSFEKGIFLRPDIFVLKIPVDGELIDPGGPHGPHGKPQEQNLKIVLAIQC
jgi:hypothetical protein